MRTIRFNIAALIIIMVTSALAGVATYQQFSKHIDPAALVYEVCQQARMSVTVTQPGQECGDLQNRLGYEYLCKDNNLSINNHCWVEEK